MPIGAALKDFAPKGGTAISLFVRDLPRFVSRYRPELAGRRESLAAIDAGMKRMAIAIGKGIPDVKVNKFGNRAESIVTKIRASERRGRL
ncbi:hypothetical protein ABIB73_003287 [Bradyrhizobium sp. F1.4.3]|uniref:hypothetical protein n=1 Tax=Bradyrhizobium sp. F1.4.3 TaxID=3156356 RepID=UPI0033978C81